MPTDRIQDDAALDAALAAERFLLFKHSTRCPISARAFAEYQAFVEAHPDVATGWVDVIRERGLSLAVAERTGVEHASPQALLLEAGRAVWTASHGSITRSTLAAQV